jgi:CBS domain-containing protein
MQKDHPSLYIDELVTKARTVIRKQGIRILPIIDENKKLVGIVYRSDIMAVTSTVSPIRVRGVMSKPKFTATLKMEANYAVKKMIQLDEWYTPVINAPEDSTFEGVLGLENFIKASLEKQIQKLNKPISDVMSTKVFTCTPEDEIDNVWRLMQGKAIAGLPVVKKEKVIGMITQKDLLDSGSIRLSFEASKGQFKTPPKVLAYMKTTVFSLKPENTLLDAAQLMIKKDIGRIPIIDAENKLIGIIDREDIVKVLL